jgi:hypothetical protein
MCAMLAAAQPAGHQSFLHFVDLAGCERVKRTGNSGARLRYATKRGLLSSTCASHARLSHAVVAQRQAEVMPQGDAVCS